jgi:ABC-2 type transport system permease protein
MSAPMSAPAGFWRAAFLLGRLRLRRMGNQFRALTRYRRGSPDRKAASRSSPASGIFTAVILLAMFGSFSMMFYNSIENIEKLWPRPAAAQASNQAGNPAGTSQAGTGAGRTDAGAGRRADVPGEQRAGPSLRRGQPAPGSVMEARVLQGVTIEATLILIAVLLGAVASQDLTKPEWDLEWLVTLPLPLSTLIGSMLIERVVANAFGFIFLGAFPLALALKCGYGLAAIPAGIGLAIPLLFLVATVQVLADTWLRLALPPARLRNLQAVANLAVVVPLLLVMSLASPDNLFMLDWAPISYDWAKWLPGGLVVQAVAGSDVWLSARWLVLLAAEVAAVIGVGSTLTWLRLRNGVVAAGAREGVARRPRPSAGARSLAPAARIPASGVRPGLWRLLPAVQRRDLTLLGRDRTLLVQTLLVPILTAGTQIFINAGNPLVRGFDRTFEPTAALAAVAFFLAAFTLMQPSFRILASEGAALWVLYTLPHSLAEVVLQKARLWGAVALVYPVVIFAIAVTTGPPIPAAFVLSAAVVLLGVPIFSLIATSLGVFAFDPLAQEEQRKIRVTHVYLYMLLGSFYAYAIFAPDIWQRLVLMILTALVAMALWQKARDQFEYLLDPAAAPPSRVSLSDGLMAALGFFVIQAVVVLFQVQAVGVPLGGRTIWIAFCAAGALTYGMMRLVYWRARTQGVPAFVGGGGLRAVRDGLRWGLLGGAVASVGGIAYLAVTSALGLFPSLRANPIADPNLPYWLAALAIAAPVFEEFLFRGLIFGGLRRSMGLPAAALASAAIFGLVHPAAAVIPVAAMGLCAALVYERTGALMAPMLVHALYNAAILGFQWNVMHLWR